MLRTRRPAHTPSQPLLPLKPTRPSARDPSESTVTITKPPSRLPRLLSIPHVAEHLGVCTKTVRRLIQSGELLATRVGRAIRVTEADLDAYLARGRSHVR